MALTLDDVVNIGSISVNMSDSVFIYFIQKGTYATLTEAKSDLAGTVIYYQLAEPEISQLQNLTPIQAFKNGTTYIDPYIKKSFTYNAGITLPYVCSQLDKVIDAEGNEVEAVLSVDGVTVTIANGIATDSYTVYAPIETSLNVPPQSSFSFPSNTKAQIEGNNKSINKLDDNVIGLQDQVAMLIVLNN